MPLDPAWTPLPLRTLDPASRALLRTAANSPVASRLNWVTATYGAGSALIPSFAPQDEDALKPPAMVAYSLAVMVATGTHDPDVTGKTDAAVRAAVVRLVWSLAKSHRANGGTWGGVPLAPGETIRAGDAPDHQNWQGALWVWLTAVAAELVWADLSTAQRDLVNAMAILEADRFLQYTVPYMRDHGGVMLSPGDTRAEENTWQASILLFCAGKFPTHARAQQWMAKGLELTLAAAATYLHPSSRRLWHGMSGWGLRGGSNLDFNGTATNHAAYDPHPNYMASIVNQAWSNLLVFAWLRGKFPAVGQAWGFRRLFRAFVDVDFPSYEGGPYLPPGGTIYDKAGGTHAIYWPQGDDGNGTNVAMFACMDVLAHLTGSDDLASTPAAAWAPVHLQRQVDLTRTSYWDFWNCSMAVFGDWATRTKPALQLSNTTPIELLT
ncbi:hypothetical protein [Microbacterium arborescens]|uniref:hypothetical protein n=1 Tax=Microbacterium arborescens TaxID=33883 RepID=UPI003C721A62